MLGVADVLGADTRMAPGYGQVAKSINHEAHEEHEGVGLADVVGADVRIAW